VQSNAQIRRIRTCNQGLLACLPLSSIFVSLDLHATTRAKGLNRSQKSSSLTRHARPLSGRTMGLEKTHRMGEMRTKWRFSRTVSMLTNRYSSPVWMSRFLWRCYIFSLPNALETDRTHDPCRQGWLIDRVKRRTDIVTRYLSSSAFFGTRGTTCVKLGACSLMGATVYSLLSTNTTATICAYSLQHGTPHPEQRPPCPLPLLLGQSSRAFLA